MRGDVSMGVGMGRVYLPICTTSLSPSLPTVFLFPPLPFTLASPLFVSVMFSNGSGVRHDTKRHD